MATAGRDDCSLRQDRMGGANGEVRRTDMVGPRGPLGLHRRDADRDRGRGGEVTDPFPLEARDLLIRLDQRVGDGFAAINQRLDAYDRRAADLDRRVDALEDAEIKRAGELAGAQRLGSWLKVVVTALVGVVGYLGYQIELAPQSSMVEHKIDITRR